MDSDRSDKRGPLTETEATQILQKRMEKPDPPMRALELISFGKEDHQD